MNRRIKSDICTVALVVGICLLGTLVSHAGDVPTRDLVTITAATSGTLTIPAFGNGDLERVQVYGMSPTGETVTVYHVMPVSTTRSLTNTVTTVLPNHAGEIQSSAITGVRLIPGDLILISCTTLATGKVSIVRSVRYP